MRARDHIAERALKETRLDIQRGADYTRPWLDLDVEAYAAYRLGRAPNPPPPWGDDPADRLMMAGVRGQNVLCLAGGGGQQSAVFSLLGARVTVVDLSPEQLESDRVAARHYGYEVETVEGDMRDLSPLPTQRFERVYQPISTLFVPDLREVYRGVFRVLRPAGLYCSQYTFPLLYMAKDLGWNGEGYGLHVSQPYARGAIYEEDDGTQTFTHGVFRGEFHHRLSDIVNGLTGEGFAIRFVWESPRPDAGPPLEGLTPGSDEHRERFLPYGLSVVAQRPVPTT